VLLTFHCAAGKYSGATGSISAANCRDCAAGKYSDATGSTSASNCQDQSADVVAAAEAATSDVVIAVDGSSNGGCTDKQPPSHWPKNTCELQKNTGGCDEWFVAGDITATSGDGSYCHQTCGKCTVAAADAATSDAGIAVDGSSNGGCHITMAGRPSRASAIEAHPEQCTDNDTTAAVRCCNDSGGGFSPDCQTLDYKGAAAHCASTQGRRLCTKGELDQTKGSGCGFDDVRAWTSSTQEGSTSRFL